MPEPTHHSAVKWNLLSLLAGVLAAIPALEASPAQVSFIPENPPGMRPLKNPDSAAHRAARQFRRGVNLGNYLEAGPTWPRRTPLPAGDFAIMRAEGFDHVRIPVAWHSHSGPAPDHALSPGIFAQADFFLTNALANQLAVIINIHHFDEFTSNSAAFTEKLLVLWRQIAAHYKDQPPPVAFELLNEPRDPTTTAMMNPIYARAIAEIRKTNPDRTIFVGPGRWNHIDELKNLVLPETDDNLIVPVHCYDPFYFTHQGATWAGEDTRVRGNEFPWPPGKALVPDPQVQLNPWVVRWISNYNQLPAAENPCSARVFEEKLRYARQWSEHYGRPVLVGEFGCYVVADPQSRARFHTAFRRALDRENLGWALWDWDANFRYWDRRQGAPMPGMREALFGKTDP
jgi:endoglucanase